MRLDVNTSEVIRLSANLEKIHKSAFPSAVRNTLNQTAFETKKIIPKRAAQKFTTRSKTLFKSFTGVNKAQGFNVKKMASVVGIISKGKPILEDGLAKQEEGGNVTRSKMIAHDYSRVSKTNKKRVRTANYLSKISNIRKKGSSNKSKYVQTKSKRGNDTVFEIKNKKLTPLYTVRKTKNVRISKQPYIYPSAKFKAKKMPEFYKKNAEFQFKKYTS